MCLPGEDFSSASAVAVPAHSCLDTIQDFSRVGRLSMFRSFAWRLVLVVGVVFAGGHARPAEPDFCEEKAKICADICDTDFAEGSTEHENCTEVCTQQHENCDRIMNTPNAGQPVDSGAKQNGGTVKQ
jgi:hypothetical protein